MWSFDMVRKQQRCENLSLSYPNGSERIVTAFLLYHILWMFSSSCWSEAELQRKRANSSSLTETRGPDLSSHFCPNPQDYQIGQSVCFILMCHRGKSESLKYLVSIMKTNFERMNPFAVQYYIYYYGLQQLNCGKYHLKSDNIFSFCLLQCIDK